jgi:hypothetical protein
MPFLLDERNRPFVQGISARPAALKSGLPVGLLLLFGLPFVLSGLFILPFTGGEWLTWLNFSRYARPVTAVVTEKAAERSSKDPAYYIAYRYSTPDGRTYGGQSLVSLDRYNSLARGQPISVEYLADSQGTSRLAEENHLIRPLFMTFFCLVGNGFVGMWAVWLARAVRQAQRLRAEGQLRPAEIISYTTRHRRRNSVPVKIEYQLVAPDGRVILGTCRVLRDDPVGVQQLACPAPAAALYIDEDTHALL